MVCKRFWALLMAGVLVLSAPASVTANAAQPEAELITAEGKEADPKEEDISANEESDASLESSDIPETIPEEDSSSDEASEEDSDLSEDLDTEDLSEAKELSEESPDFMEEYKELVQLEMPREDTDFTRYSANEQAIVSSFTMSWKGHSVIDLMANNAAYYEGTMKVPVDLTDYDGKTPFHFEIGVENASCVKSIDVIASIAGTDYTLVATGKNGTGTFVADGFFDEGNDCEFLTSIRLKLNSNKPMTIFNPDNLGFDYDSMMVERYAFFNENIPGLVTTRVVDGLTEYTIDYGKLYEKTQKRAVKGVIKFTAGKAGKTIEAATGLGIDVLKNSGYFIHGLDEDQYLFYEDKTQEDFELLEYFTDAGETYGDVMKVRLAFMEESGYSYDNAGYNFADDSLKEFSELWDQSVKAVGLARDINKYAKEREETYDEINRSTTIVDKEKARKQADELYKDKCAYNIIKEVVIPMILASGGIELAAAGPAGLVFGGLLLAIDVASDWMWDARAAQIMGGSIGVSKSGGFSYDDPLAGGCVDIRSSVLRTVLYNPNDPESGYKWMEDWDFDLYGYTTSGITLTLEGNHIKDAEPFRLELIPYIYELSPYITTIVFTNNTYNNSIYISNYKIRNRCCNVTRVSFSPFAKTIGGFESFTGLKSVVIPGSVEEIGTAAFYKSGIETVTFKSTSSLKKIGESAFRSCQNLQGTIDIPGKKISIGKSAFYESQKIRKIIIRGELECIDYCFPSSSGYNKSQLKEIWFYGPIDNISSTTMYISTYLDKVYILGGIKGSDRVFEDRPDNVTRTDDFPFQAKEIYFSGTRAEWEKLFPYHYYSPYNETERIHFGYREDGSEAGVETGKCGDGLTYNIVDPGIKHDPKNGDWYDLYISGTGAMYDYAKQEDVPWYGYRIRKIAIANGITRIGNYAFYGQEPQQESIDIPMTVKEIGDYAFAQVKCNGSMLVIPDNVEKLGDYCFYFYKAETLYISRRLTRIPVSCFTGVHLKGSVVIPENVKEIGDYAFGFISKSSKDSLVYDIRGAEKIGYGAFYSSSYDDEDEKPTFKNTDFLKRVKEIGGGAFYYSTISGDLEFSPELTSIGYNTFEGCTGITGIIFGSKLTRIEDRAFRGCSSMTGTLTLPSSLEYIGNYAFFGCAGLTGDLIIPNSVTDIGTMAFKDCTGFNGKLALPSRAYSGCRIGCAAFDSCSGFTGELVIRLNKLVPANFTDHKFYRTFYGLTNLEKITVIRGDYGYEDALNGIVKSGAKGSFDEWKNSDLEDRDEEIIISTFPANTKIDCDDEAVYKKFKELGYKANLSDKANGFTIRFDAGGYFSLPDLVNQKTIPNLPGLAIPGLIFAGWYLTPGCEDGQEAVYGMELTQDITVYAKFETKEVLVTFIAGNGTLPEGTESSKKVTYGLSYGELPTPIPNNAGESFIGWYTEETGGSRVKADITVSIANDHNLYARYKNVPALTAPYVTDAAGNRYEDGSELNKGTRLYLRTAEDGTRIYFTTVKEEAPILQDADDHLYRTALLLTEDVTVYARAYKEGYKCSDTVSYSFKVKDAASDWDEVEVADRDGFADATKVPEQLWAAGIADSAYTGSAVTFDNLRVYFGKKLLTEGTDYTVKYSGNVKASTDKSKANVTITCKGNYTGKKSFAYNIMPLELGSSGVNSDRLTVADVQAEATGKKIQLATTVTYDLNGKETVLKKGTDFVYDYSEVGTDPDVYTVKLVGKGNFTGTATFKQTIYPKAEKINIAKLTFGKIDAQAADGSRKEPQIVIKDKITDKKNPHVLTSEEFSVRYFNNVLAGSATAVVTGKGNYGGTKTLTFKITGTAIAKAKFDIGSVTYSGEAQVPSYKLTYQASKKDEVQTLTEGVDFEVTASNNIKKGSGTLTFTGIGKYAGTVKKTFKINPLGFKEGDVNFVCRGESSKEAAGDLGSFVYTKNGVMPEFKLMYGGKELTRGSDYTVKYANNNAVGGTGKKAPSLTVTGAGNFTGTFTRTFAITAGSLENARVTASDIQYSGKAGNVKPVITVYDANGVKLAAGKDYDSKNYVYTYVYSGDIFIPQGKDLYMRHVEEGDTVDLKKHVVIPGTVIRVTVKGKGLYAGSENYAEFTCVNTLMSKATIKLKKAAFDYTGENIEIDESDIVVTVGGKAVPDNAYRIESITGNVRTGTATVTVAGNGLCGELYYGGTKTVTFKINARKIK